ncbi:hypothetical protein BT63DRAFT_484417 [Microthyrium microscopicum]|uniref:Uncharacterized protein n=1 Tax=Microthyrium microscopicum TaxID=703497 RepID=A0A6A6TTF7_9PEZI|nr:hypothetical protein BT63DRAFT_484417 [Microthyrium microscopicum]
MAPTPTSDSDFQALDAALEKLNTYSKLLQPNNASVPPNMAEFAKSLFVIKVIAIICLVGIIIMYFTQCCAKKTAKEAANAARQAKDASERVERQIKAHLASLNKAANVSDTTTTTTTAQTSSEPKDVNNEPPTYSNVVQTAD